MLRKVLLAITLVVVVIGALAAVKVVQIKSMIAAGASFQMPPEAVSSAKVRRVTWESVLSAVGTVTPAQGAVLRTEVAGIVKNVAFESGSIAKRGQVLVELDRSAEEANLGSAEARLALATANLARTKELQAQSIVSASSLDSAEAAYRQASSDVAGFRVAIAKKIIRAPFDGRLGIRQINLGQFADVGTAIVPLQSLDPVYVDFSLPEQSAGNVSKGMTVRVTSDAIPGRTFEGVLTAVSPEVDPASRELKLQATFTGTDGVLLPGMFARAEVVMPETISPLVVPVTAVQFAPYGDSVFVIGDVKDEKTGATTKRVRMTTVKLGETRGDLVVVESGVKEGDEVATAGVFKLRNDSSVVVNNELVQPATTSPQPKDS
jgi:membrane fusion protein (multidrug efflux system)